jgi:FkbH-like protein
MSTESLTVAAPRETARVKEVKCVVWDLDDTLWEGVLLEHGGQVLRPGVRAILQTLDARGILHSIASRNDHDHAMARLKALGIDEFFLYPQIGWHAKSQSVRAIAERINIGIDTLAFVDDQPFERDEVHFACPGVLCLDAAALLEIPGLPQLNPRFVTEDSRQRRRMYLADIERRKTEESFEGPEHEFLASLGMTFTIRAAQEEDLKRAEELTARTNQLNTTGYTYSYEELDALRHSPEHLLLIAGLEDRYGTYGKIGLALTEKRPGTWNIRLLLMSCRVMSRGVGNILINHIRSLAHEAGVALTAEMVTTDRNRMMYMTYKFLGFTETSVDGPRVLFTAAVEPPPPAPAYVTVVVE